MKDIFITSPIYYVNDIPHIGHAYTTIACDAFKKYQILKGNNAILLTGTDEHGQKIENSAKAKGKSAQEYADEISAKFRNLWDYFGIDYDYFVRTTDDYHDCGVKRAFEIMQKKGDIYKGQYEGNYCVSCETFFTKRQLIDGEKCPDCGKPTKEIKEESYFFALSKYEKRLLSWYEENADVILPKFKRNEVIKFVENGLSDLSITRSTFSWGISLPKSANDTTHIIYVWLDALLSYITPLGFGNGGDCGGGDFSDSTRDSRANKMSLFENAYHFVGKDILRFHAIFWPAFLMSLDLPLPKRIFTHGWWLIEGAKMSKSVGNVVNPKDIADNYGLEILRYFLLREVPFGQDGDFAIRALIERANAELSDSLGNLLNRVLGMSEKYFALKIQSSDFSAFKDEWQIIESTLGGLDSLMESMATNRYLEEVWKLFDLANGMVTKYAPWELMKQNRRDEAQSVLVFIANLLAKGAVAIYPILPKSAEAIMHSLGANLDYDLIAKNAMITKFSLIKIPPLFPKFEVDSIPQKSPSLRDFMQSVELKKDNALPQIKIDDFKKIDIRVGEILEANRIEGSEKLLVFQIDFGDFGKRQIVSGIAQFYAPKELVGKKICAIINLKPTKIMGVKSDGMLLTAVEQIAESSAESTLDSATSTKPAESSEKVTLLFTDSAIGSQVC